MDKNTISALDKLNQQFYQKHAQSFDQTRQSFWAGWFELKPLLDKLSANNQKISVLDVGCGNARFAEFLAEQNYQFNYLGIDNNQQLLDQAQRRLTKLQIKFELKNINLVDSLLNSNLLKILTGNYDCIVAFGVLHHIPSLQLRQKFIQELGQLLKNKQSLLITTAWQFAQQQRFNSKNIEAEKFKISPQQLELNDYLLDWQNDATTPRYCHFMNEAEAKKINHNIDELALTQTFLADGKSNDLNLYLIWSKIPEEVTK